MRNMVIWLGHNKSRVTKTADDGNKICLKSSKVLPRRYTEVIRYIYIFFFFALGLFKINSKTNSLITYFLKVNLVCHHRYNHCQLMHAFSVAWFCRLHQYRQHLAFSLSLQNNNYQSHSKYELWWRLIMEYFLQTFSTFHWFKKSSYGEWMCTNTSWLLQGLSLPRKSVVR